MDFEKHRLEINTNGESVMSMNRRTAIKRLGAFLAIGSAIGSQSAWAGHEVNNDMGKINGTYKCDLKIKEKDKEDRTIQTKCTVVDRYVDIYLVEGENPVHAHIDSIYTFGYKSEIMAHDADKNMRFICKINGQLGD